MMTIPRTIPRTGKVSETKVGFSLKRLHTRDHIYP